MRTRHSSRNYSWMRLGRQKSAKSIRTKPNTSRKLRCEALEQRNLLSIYYVDATDGNDSWDGLAGSYDSGSGPWQTLDKVNNATLSPGDSVLFKRGETWREHLVPKSGSAAGRLTFDAYGDSSDPLPLFLGSVERNLTANWTNTSGNLWSSGSLPVEVGNIIFDNETCGYLRFSINDVTAQGDFYYDASADTVTVYSTSNPASYYSDIELAQDYKMIDVGSYATYNNLALSYCAGFGVRAADNYCDNVTFSGLSISYMGGATRGTNYRLGNGIEFWNSASNILVDGCKIWEIYDTGVTHQGSAVSAYHENIVYQNNVIWNCEYSFEFWSSGASSSFEDIYFENNTCAFAGYGWGSSQRPGGMTGGRHVLGTSAASVTDFYIRNNIFSESTFVDLQMDTAREGGDWMASYTLDYNLYSQTTHSRIAWNEGENVDYTISEFEDYQDDSGQESHSFLTPPEFVAPLHYDFQLDYNSPAIDSGTNTGIGTDFNGDSRPRGLGYDIGAYERGVLEHAWKFENNLNDSVGTTNGTGTGDIAYVDGLVNKALEFDGSGDYVTVSYGSGERSTTPATYTLWVNADAVTSTDRVCLVQSTWSSGWARAYVGYAREGDGKSYWQMGIGNSGYVDGNTTLEATTGWHFIALVFDGSYANLYVDGDFVYQKASGNFVFNQNLTIGGCSLGVADWDGKIDEARVYSIDLSAEEISRIYLEQEESYWAFEGDLDDSVGTLDGTGTGDIAYVDGYVDQGLDFDGSGDYVTASYGSGESSTTPVTYTLWVNSDEITSTNRVCLVQSTWSGGTAMAYVGYAREGDGESYWQMGIGSSSFVDGDTTLEATTGWHHIAMVFDGSYANLYVDGNFIYQKSSGSFNFNQNLTIGGCSLGSYDWDGKIDEVRVYSRDLSAAEISDIYLERGESFWAFDGNFQDYVGDKPGVGVGAIADGTAYVDGAVNQALDFDGTDDYVTMPYGSGKSSTTPATYTLWVNPDEITSTNRLCLVQSTWTSGWQRAYVGYAREGDGKSYWQMGVGISGIIDGNTTLEATTGWHHIAMVFDGVYTSLYVDGDFVYQKSSGDFTFTQDLSIGGCSIGSVDWDGKIDHVHAYSRDLSAEEISDMYLEQEDSFWAFDGNMEDSVGTLDGTGTGDIAYVDGYVDRALDFDGSGDYVTIPYGSGESSTTPATYALWVNSDAVTSTDRLCLVQSTWGGTARAYVGYAREGDGKSYWQMGIGSSSIGDGNTTSQATAGWHFIALVFDGSYAKLYVDGDYVYQKSSGSFNFNQDLTIGGCSLGVADWDGKIDQVRVYSRDLSAAEIGDIYSEQEDSFWAFDGNLEDSVGGKDGTGTGDVAYVDGLVNQALEFDGSGDYVTMPYGDDKSSTTPATYTLWVNADAITSTDRVCLVQSAWGGTSRAYVGYAREGDGKSYWQMGIGTSGIVDGNTTSEATTGWHFIALVFDGSYAKLYVDGDYVYQKSSGNFTFNQDLTIGGCSLSGADWDGKIDHVHVYSEDLSAAQISDMYLEQEESYWAFDGNLKDYVGGKDGVGVGTIAYATAYVDGHVDRALDFDGSGDYVTMPYGSGESSTATATYTMWVNSDAITSTDRVCLVQSSWTGGTAMAYVGYAREGDGKSYWQMGIGSSSIGDGDTTLEATTGWHFVALVFDGSYAKLYVDGNFVYQKSSGSFTFNQELSIGGCSLGSYDWDGKIDEVRVYSSDLSAAEISTLYGVRALAPPLAGDANLDGRVDGSDVTILAGNWQHSVTGEPNATWSMGDFNGDGKVDGSDVTILAGNWQAGVSSAVVAVSDPEPFRTSHFTPPATASLGVATIATRESLSPRRFIAPTPQSTDTVLAESSWSETDMTAIAKDLTPVSVKKMTAASDELFALELDPYSDLQ